MTIREVRISTDGDSVAVRSDNAADSWNAWAVMNCINGGYWAKEQQVSGWNVVSATTPAVVPEPEEPPLEEPPV